MAEPRKFRDPVHGFISLTAKEAEIVNTPVFQRLRGIKQLALANLVYPGALHTRFEHSLAVCHVASSMAKELHLSQEETGIVRLAALLHDIGHGPFSHVSENLLELYSSPDKLSQAKTNREEIHELISADIIRNDMGLSEYLCQADRNAISELLLHGYNDPILKSIVSGPLDADKQDYLLRDSHYCGVKYGVFDMFQLHRELEPRDDPMSGLRQMMISPEGVHAVEQFILAKYHISNQVYKHRIRLITDQMLTRAIRLGIECDCREQYRKLYSYDGTDSFLKNYIDWNDEKLLSSTENHDAKKDQYSTRILKRLRERRLYKRLFSGLVKDIAETRRNFIIDVMNPENKLKRDAVEKEVCVIINDVLSLKIDPREVILYTYDIKSVRGKKREDEGTILVSRRPSPKPFEAESTLFRSISETASESFVEIYAPIQYNTPAEREGILNKLKRPILDGLGQLSSN